MGREFPPARFMVNITSEIVNNLRHIPGIGAKLQRQYKANQLRVWALSGYYYIEMWKGQRIYQAISRYIEDEMYLKKLM